MGIFPFSIFYDLGVSDKMIRMIKAGSENQNDWITVRLAMLREVNHLPESYQFPDSFVKSCCDYFENGHQTTVLAYDDDKIIGCATLCYLNLLPTFDHPTGRRAHLMNVYTQKEFRKQGIASTMLYLLTEEAKENGVTEITLDATEHGKGLYQKYGFVKSEECMVLNFREQLKKNIERYEKFGCKPYGHCGE